MRVDESFASKVILQSNRKIVHVDPQLMARIRHAAHVADLKVSREALTP
jgi:hypothetical protein